MNLPDVAETLRLILPFSARFGERLPRDRRGDVLCSVVRAAGARADTSPATEGGDPR